MKKFFALAAMMVLLSTTSAYALLANSAHDFSTSGWTTEICAPCHTPHNAISGAGPLWSHAPTGATFTMYNAAFSSTMDMVVAGQPQGISAACLSCHDGVTNLDAFVGSTGGFGGTTPMGAISANVGTDLTNDHPISVTYDNTLDTAFQAIGVPSAAPFLLEFYGGASDQMECATCHDVHRTNAAIPSLLRYSNAASGLCLACHIK